MSKTLEDLWNEIEIIKNNHLEHIKMDIDHLKENVNRIETKVDKIVDKTDGKLDKMDARLWWIFTLIVGGGITTGLVFLANKLGMI